MGNACQPATRLVSPVVVADPDTGKSLPRISSEKLTVAQQPQHQQDKTASATPDPPKENTSHKPMHLDVISARRMSDGLPAIGSNGMTLVILSVATPIPSKVDVTLQETPARLTPEAPKTDAEGSGVNLSPMIPYSGRYGGVSLPGTPYKSSPVTAARRSSKSMDPLMAADTTQQQEIQGGDSNSTNLQAASKNTLLTPMTPTPSTKSSNSTSPSDLAHSGSLRLHGAVSGSPATDSNPPSLPTPNHPKRKSGDSRSTLERSETLSSSAREKRIGVEEMIEHGMDPKPALREIEIGNKKIAMEIEKLKYSQLLSNITKVESSNDVRPHKHHE